MVQRHTVCLLASPYCFSVTEDSDSESETSSEEEVTQNGSSSGGRRTSGAVPSGGQKRHRKKRGVAIPVATPKVPTLPPTTAPPRLPLTNQDLDKGKKVRMKAMFVEG